MTDEPDLATTNITELWGEDDFDLETALEECPLYPRHGFIVLKEWKDRGHEQGGIIVPPKPGQVQLQYARAYVLRIGPGRQNEYAVASPETTDAGFRPIPVDDLEPGQEVYISELVGQDRITHEGKEWIVADERSVVATVS
jgi:co-chaperonin GroES (HSP10)